MSDIEEAVSGLEKELNCCQSVLSIYGPRFGLDRELAIKLASGFGGGIGHQGETCGAVTGAIMAIGLKYGGVLDEDSTEKLYGLIAKYLEKFKARHGSTHCRELLDCDITTPQGLQVARDQGLFEKLCPNFVRTSAEILEEIL